jgi:phage terminase large subunit
VTATALKGKSLAAKIASSPRWFAKKIFGLDTWDRQEEVVASIFTHKRTAVRGCVSSTKTFAAALATMAWLLAHPRDGRVFHLAPSFRQVDTNMWGYLRALDAKATANGTPIGAKVYKEPRIEFGPGWGYMGFSTDNPHNVHGIHGPNDLIVLDDAHGIPQQIFDELENMFAGGNTRLLMLFNPVVLQGETYNCAHVNKGIWNNIVIAFADLKRAYQAGHIMPGALQQEAVDLWARKFGVKSSFYLSKVDAQYPLEEKDCVVPLSWVEAAVLREVPPAGVGQVWHGQDVARFGDDESARCTIEGRRALPIDARQGDRTTETAGRLIAEIRSKGGAAAVDVIGVGSGVVDTCYEQGVSVIAVNVAEKSEVLDEAGKEKFADLRSEMYWGGREALDPLAADALAIDADDKQLHGELSSIKWKFDGKGRIRVESKEDMKKRLGHSPDRADAFCLAVYARKRSGITINIPHSTSNLLAGHEGSGELSALGGLDLG